MPVKEFLNRSGQTVRVYEYDNEDPAAVEKLFFITVEGCVVHSNVNTTFVRQYQADNSF